MRFGGETTGNNPGTTGIGIERPPPIQNGKFNGGDDREKGFPTPQGRVSHIQTHLPEVGVGVVVAAAAGVPFASAANATGVVHRPPDRCSDWSVAAAAQTVLVACG